MPDIFEEKLGGKIIKDVVAIRPKTYAYLTDDGDEHKKVKGTRTCVITREIMFVNYTECLFDNKNVYKSQHRFKSYNHDVYTEEVNKTALSSNDDKRLQTHDRIKTYPDGTNAFKVCKSEMLNSKGFIL